MREIANRLLYRLHRLRPGQDRFLKKVAGVVHVGANVGQERELYASLGLNVLWVEPIPTVFELLRANIASLCSQRAVCELLADEHGKECTLHIANNCGASSSILDLSRHRDMWPDIHYVSDLRVTATTLCRLVEAEKIDLDDYGALVLDTQGAELLVLKGATSALPHFKFIKTEVADFDSYAGCCRPQEMTAFLFEHGFVEEFRVAFAGRRGVGTYYEVLYKRAS